LRRSSYGQKCFSDFDNYHYSRRATAICTAVCLSVFQTISQKPTQLGSSNLTHKCSTMSPRNSFILGSKGQRSRSQRLCRSSDRTQYRRFCVRKSHKILAPHKQCCDTGFSLCCFTASACRWTMGFSRRGFLHSCECRILLILSARRNYVGRVQ